MLYKNLLRVISILVLLPASMGMARASDNSRWGAGYFPNVELTTQDGKTVHFFDDLLKGKAVVIDLIYTHCVDSCPLETARLAQVQQKLGDRVGKDVFFYSITIDPKRDTPEVLKAYADKYHVGPGWLFLTGRQDDIDLISKKLGLYSPPTATSSDGHAPGVLIGNQANGQWMRASATDNAGFLAATIGNFMPMGTGRRAGPMQSYSEAPHIKFDKGNYLFHTRCAACHTIGHGDKIGPDLLGVTGVRDRAWLLRMIQVPDKILAEGDPVATALFEKYKQVQMPNLRLTDDETAALVDFLQSRQQTADNAAAGKAQPVAP